MVSVCCHYTRDVRQDTWEKNITTYCYKMVVYSDIEVWAYALVPY